MQNNPTSAVPFEWNGNLETKFFSNLIRIIQVVRSMFRFKEILSMNESSVQQFSAESSLI